MTNEEMERALEFLVKSQAAFDARQAAFEERQAALDVRLEQTNQQIAEMSRQIQIQAETQTEFIQIVTRTLEGQAEINASLRAADARAYERGKRTDERLDRLAEMNAQTDERGKRTDERLDRLSAAVERHITGGNGAT
jgi:septal ring factor EnvC (AmiA/AmiB activator)